MAQLVPCEYRGGQIGTRKVRCCRGHPAVNLPVYDCTLGNTGHGGARGVTWRDCRTYRHASMCKPETCLASKLKAQADGEG